MKWPGLVCVTVAAACGNGSSMNGDPADAGVDATDCVSFTQWGRDSAHQGAPCVTGQPTTRILGRVFYDPFVEQEKDLDDGAILVHYQAPLLVGEDIYMMSKAGTYTECPPAGCQDGYYRNSQVWVEKAYRWENDQLVEKWMFASDWKPEPVLRFEAMFQPAVAGGFIYVPGAGGTLHKLDRRTGLPVTRLNPFGTTVDPDTYVAGALTADRDGTIYYTALKLDHDEPFSGEADASGWLVKITAADQITLKTFQELVTGAPAATDMCRFVFSVREHDRPWPPPDVEGQPVYPPEVPCLSQRPAINAAPAIGADGTIFIVSRAHGNDRIAFITALNPDLSTKWVRSLDKVLDDGCGVRVPYGTGLSQCREGARAGVDPMTNEPPSARVNDSSSSSPVALPDGGVLYGSYSAYNGARGHLLKLDAAGTIAATHDFGWDTTPAIYRHDGTYSIIIKDNSYGADPGGGGFPAGPFYIKQLDTSLQTEWMYRSSNTMSCTRADDGNITCINDHPNGFEWCINAPVVDQEGTVFANSEDGNLYAIGQGGTEKGRIFLEMALGAAYTPLALDATGRVFTMNDGVMTVIGQ